MSANLAFKFMNHKKPKILVIGDVMLDQYSLGQSTRVSPDDNTTLALRIGDGTDTRHRLGGAGNVAANVISMGAEALLLGTIGRDPYGQVAISKLAEIGIPAESVLQREDQVTTVKIRYVLESNMRPLLRVDREVIAPITDTQATELFKHLSALLEKEWPDLVILSDYAKGVFLNAQFLKVVIAALEKVGVPYFVDPKCDDFNIYGPAMAICPNADEANMCVNETLIAEHIVITHGAEGCRLIHPASGEQFVIPGMPAGLTDATGCGDSFLAGLAVAFASGMDMSEAARVANAAGACAVSALGAVGVQQDDVAAILQLMEELEGPNSEGEPTETQ